MDETFPQALRRLRGTRSLRDVAQLAACGKTHVGDLENGRRRPTREIAEALDRALGADGFLVALAAIPAGASVRERAAVLREGLHEALAAGPMSDAALDEWAYTIARHGRATRYRPEGELLIDLVDDFSDLRLLLAHRHPAHVRKRLTVTAAYMAGLLALTLLKLGDTSARAWWRSGRAAAAAADDREVLSWIYAQQAYQAYYDGDMGGAIDLARRSQDIAGGLPCVGPALAAPLEARAHAILGDRNQTVTALTAGEAALARLPEEHREASAFAYSESQFRFHAGNAWTHLQDIGAATTEQARALELYPVRDHTDRTLIRLDQAICMIYDGAPAAAAAHASTTLVELPEEHRSTLIISRAQQLLGSVPRQAQQVPEVLMLREILALPAGERD